MIIVSSLEQMAGGLPHESEPLHEVSVVSIHPIHTLMVCGLLCRDKFYVAYVALGEVYPVAIHCYSLLVCFLVLWLQCTYTTHCTVPMYM